MKKIILMFLIVSLLLCGCAAPGGAPAAETRAFTDSTGRTVTLPAKITKIAVSGPLSQIYMIPLAGDMLVGVSNAYAEDAQIYLPPYISEKTEIGQLYGGLQQPPMWSLTSANPRKPLPRICPR